MTTEKEPNRDEPLSEPSIHRRIWAAYLAKGYTRTSFARVIDAHYNALRMWDVGKHDWPLMKFIAASHMVGFTPNELIFGRSDRPNHASMGFVPNSDRHATHEFDEELSPRQIARVLETQSASRAAFAALAQLYLDSAHWYSAKSRTFVSTFARVFDDSENLTHQNRVAAALSAAVNAQSAMDAAVADGRIAAPSSADRTGVHLVPFTLSSGIGGGKAATMVRRNPSTPDEPDAPDAPNGKARRRRRRRSPSELTR